ncbi:hypothetical protein BJ138DRAFT_1107760 [Hygrophoropsis aurantiaca]|uniref:Uncharacterized protein n=1 Tax=Hygrophoropsis aurantiaca TaxID=72124 RepID=A0ACB7ZQH6_9AGAM|nr:hypothetical protein BJ138DRAFT_1107760 [Hygrophoropsis aurantiaca]
MPAYARSGGHIDLHHDTRPPERPQTPFKYSFSSTPLKTKKQRQHIWMDRVISDELKNVKIMADAQSFLDFLFPNSVTFANVKDRTSISKVFKILSQTTGRTSLYSKRKWSTKTSLCPEFGTEWTRQTEPNFAAFLNKILSTVASNLSLGKWRTWTAKYATQHVTNTASARKPDLLLMDGPAVPGDWRCIRVVGEMKQADSPAANTSAYKNLAEKSNFIFSAQDNRRFVLSVAFCGPTMSLILLDRGGFIQTTCFNIHKQPKLFLHALLALSFADLNHIGYDATITSPGLADVQTRQIAIHNQVSYQMRAVLFIADSIVGRGTVVWMAERKADLDVDEDDQMDDEIDEDEQMGKAFDSEQVVIKDTWFDLTRKWTEGDILRHISPVKGVLRLIHEERITAKTGNLPPGPDTTDALRTLSSAI